MTRDEALALLETKWWLSKTPHEIATFQLNEPRLCMPFGDFQEAVEKALGRGVFTHEFVDPKSLLAEMRGDVSPRTIDDILAMIPAHKQIVIVKEEPRR